MALNDGASDQNTTVTDAGRHYRRRYVLFVGLVLVSAGLVRLLIALDLFQSGLLYLGLPALVSFALLVVRPLRAEGEGYGSAYARLIGESLVVFFLTALVLREGWLCVLMFLPIYLLVATVVYVSAAAAASRAETRSRVFVAPLLLLALSLEGTAPEFSLPRYDSVTVTRVAASSPDALLARLARPIDLEHPRHWLLRFFPMPYESESEGWHVGATHVLRTRYHRWLVSNTHEGELVMKIVEADGLRFRSTTIHNTTYFSHYLTLLDNELVLRQTDAGGTEIRLTLGYRRDLDPAWYFRPLMRVAMTQMAHLLIEQGMLEAAS